MRYRPATVDEITQRVRNLAWWVGLALYLIVGLGGSWLFYEAVQDGAWREIFISVWWLPSGAVAWWLWRHLEHYVLRSVPEVPEVPETGQQAIR